MKVYVLTYGISEYNQEGYYYHCCWVGRPTKDQLNNAMDVITGMDKYEAENRSMISDSDYYKLALGEELSASYYTFLVKIEDHLADEAE